MSVPRFDPEKLTQAANDTVTVRRVFGEAYERDGVTVIPVARVYAATGLGLGDGEGGLPSDALPWFRRAASVLGEGDAATVTGDSEPLDTGSGTTESGDTESGADKAAGYGGGHGGGGGYGAHVKAVGVYVIDSEGVHWRPALDLNRVILGGQLMAASAVSALCAAVAVKAAARAIALAIAARRS